MAALLLVIAVIGCGGNTVRTIAPTESGASPTTTAGEPTPAATNAGGPTITPTPESSTSPSEGNASPSPSDSATGCSGTEANLAFFRQAAGAMSWAVYCAVLPDGWYLETGSYRLANDGHLEVTYRGPGDGHLAIAEGNICDGLGDDVDVCTPRDTLIGPAAMGDQTGELGRLANGLVLDVERGANPSWRVTGLGISEADFVAICRAVLRVAPGG